jgi:hypothetical protein
VIARTQIKSTTNSKRIYAEPGDTIIIIGQSDPVLFVRNMRTGEKFPMNVKLFKNEVHEDAVDGGHREPEQPAGSNKGNKVESPDKGNGNVRKGNKDAIQGGHTSPKQIGLFD